MPELVWTQRWKALKAAGFTERQAVTVYNLFDATSGFGSRTVAESAMRQLREVYSDPLSEDAREVFDWLLDGADPAGWGVPTDFEAWELERFERALTEIREALPHA